MKLKYIISTNLKVASSSEPLSSIIDKMQTYKISSIVVVDEVNHPIGIFTEFDAIKIVASSLDIEKTMVFEIIKEQTIFVLNEEIDIYEAFSIMQQKHFRHIVVVDGNNIVKGIATQSDFLKYIDTEMLIKLKVTADVMTQKVFSLTKEHTLDEAARLMLENRVSSLIVIDDINKPIGIVTERDMVKYASAKHSQISLVNAMSSPIQTIKNSDTLSSCLSKMEELKIRRLAVVNNQEELSGIITRHDILKSIQNKKIEVLSQTIKQKNYELEIIKKQDEELKLLDVALRSSVNAIVITDIDAKILWCNQAFVDLTGYKEQEAIGKKPNELIYSGKQSLAFYEKLWNTILSKHSFKGEIINKKKDGTLYNENLTITPILDSDDNITHFVAIKEDITEIKKLQSSIVESEARFKNLFDNAPLPYQSLNDKGFIVEVNKAWLQLGGYKYEEVINTHIAQYLNINSARFNSLVQRFKANKEIKHEIIEFITKNKEIKIIELNGRMTEDYKLSTFFTHCLLTDITEKKEMMDKIDFIAHYDPLTSLPNKVSLFNQLNQSINRSKKNKQRLALMVVGIDRFKDINDSFGHIVGDELLTLVASKIKAFIKEFDYISRVNGDEFGILVENMDSQEDCAGIANELLGSINGSYVLSNNISVYISSSIGIAVYPDNALDTQSLLQHADAALYLAKREGNGKFRFYNNELTLRARKNIAFSSSLQNSIINNEFIVLYQPQVDIKSGKILGFESLVRWKSGSRIISPMEFIKLAEERGLISGITQFVVKQSCEDLVEFRKHSCNQKLKLSINVSSIELDSIYFNKTLLENIKEHKIMPENIVLEVTESIFIKDIQGAINTLIEVKNSGFSISLDDFGTGYSSLSYLKKIPLDIIKIDKSFIDGIPLNSDDMQITRTIISMAKSLNLKVLAEGVETKEQLEFLKEEECDYYQGYYFAKPISADEIIQLLKKEEKCVE